MEQLEIKPQLKCVCLLYKTLYAIYICSVVPLFGCVQFPLLGTSYRYVDSIYRMRHTNKKNNDNDEGCSAVVVVVAAAMIRRTIAKHLTHRLYKYVYIYG